MARRETALRPGVALGMHQATGVCFAMLACCGQAWVEPPAPANPPLAAEPEAPTCAPPPVEVGSLPEGIGPDPKRDDIERVLGAPSYCRGDTCSYLSHGLDLTYTRERYASARARPVCLQAVAKRAPLEVGVMRIEQWTASRVKYGATPGFQMSADYEFHAPGPGKLVTRMRLEDARQRPVQVATRRVKHDGQCHALDARAVTIASSLRDSASGTFMHHQLDLPEGEQEVTFVLEAEFVQDGAKPVPLQIAGNRATKKISQPAMRWVKVGVRRIQVAKAPPTEWNRLKQDWDDEPDLVWTTEHDAVIKVSQVRDNSFDAKWSDSSDWMRAALDDDVDVTIVDKDVQYDDRLDRFGLPISTIVASASDGTLGMTRGPLTITIGVETAEKAPAGEKCKPAPLGKR